MRGGTAVIGKEGAEHDGAKEKAVDDVDVWSRRTDRLRTEWRRQAGGMVSEVARSRTSGAE